MISERTGYIGLRGAETCWRNRSMRYGISIENFGWFGDINLMLKFAVEAEKAGWDGFFLWDHLQIFPPSEAMPFIDSWMALASIAVKTKKMRLGPMVTPLPRRRPWKLAREAATLDHLSNGRLTLGVGIGAPPNPEFASFGEDTNPRTRAEKLDEGLDVITGLWSGEAFSYEGKHYHVHEARFLPKPKQQPRVPIWIGGGWPKTSPFRRAAKYDGVVPVHTDWPKRITTANLEEILRLIESERGNLRDYDVAVSGHTAGNDSTEDRELMQSWIDAGATWWLEEIESLRGGLEELRERVERGPPQA